MPTSDLTSVGVRNPDGSWGSATLQVDWNSNNLRVTAARIVASGITRTFRATITSPLLPGGEYVMVVVPGEPPPEQSIPGSAGLTWGPEPGSDDPAGGTVLDGAGPVDYGFSAG